MRSRFLSSFETEAESESFLCVISDPMVRVWACQILFKDDKIERPFHGDNGQFLLQECRKIWITKRILAKGLENSFEL